MIKNKLILALVLLFSMQNCLAQQESSNSQFMMNKLYLNPGYAGYKEVKNITLIHRNQWVGFKGAPMTTSLAYDSPLKNTALAVGGNLRFDKIGPITQTGIYGSFAIRNRLSNSATISWGLSGSLDMLQVKLTDLVLTSDFYGKPEDAAFMYNVKGRLLPNVGFGAYYTKGEHFIGLSCPKMLRPKLNKEVTPQISSLSGKYEPTIYIMGGKQFKISKDFEMQGSVLVRAVWNAPMSIGLFANTIIYKEFNVGLNYNLRESIGLMCQWQINTETKVGYSFDVSTNQMIRANWGSHELALNHILSPKETRVASAKLF